MIANIINRPMEDAVVDPYTSVSDNLSIYTLHPYIIEESIEETYETEE